MSLFASLCSRLSVRASTPPSARRLRRRVRRIQTLLANALLFLIPLLAVVWLLTVKPANAQYSNYQWWECPGGGTCAPPGSTGGSNTGYPGGTGGSNTGYPGGNTGSNTGYPGGNTGGSGTGYPGGSTGGSGTGGSGTGYPGGTGGSNTGYPGGNTGSNTGYPGGNTGSNTGSNTGYSGSGSNTGSNSGYPGGNTGSNSGSNTGSNTGYPGGTGGSNTGSNSGYPGGGTNGSGTNGGNTGGSGTGGSGTAGSGTGGSGTGGSGTIVPGHWDVSYSSRGTTSWHYVGYDANYKSTAKPDSRQWPATGSGDGVQDSNYLDAKMTGTVTAKLTWVPTTGQDTTSDPPASSVIVTEYAGASTQGGSGMGKADDGWGDTSGQAGYASSSGTHYEVKDGSSGSITVTSGTLSASTPDNTTPDANGNFSGLGVLVSTGFNVAGTNATISLSGVNAANQALTGQGVTAHLNGAPANVSSYTWSFTGGTPIKNWDQKSSQTVPLAPADLSLTDSSGNGISVAPVSFYYTQEGSLTVTCTVKVTLPDGTPKTITVQSKKIAYKKPTVDWKVDEPFNGLTSGFFYGYTDYSFGALELWGPIKITEPPSFAPEGSGTGCIVQIATLDRSFTRHNPQNGQPDTTYSMLTVSNNDGTTSSVKAPTGLDVGFPYPFGYDQNTDGTFTPRTVAYTWKASDKGFAADKPHQAYYTKDVDGGGNNWYASQAKDSFDTYVMYQPPSKDGQGTIYVPLQKLTWKWGGDANLYANKWSTSEGPPSFDPGKPTKTDTYPSWTLTIPFQFKIGP